MKHLITALVCASTAASGADWPNWRGPNHDGISTETGWNAQWPADGPKQLWKAAVGIGFSSVAVSQGRVYTMGNERDTDTVFCLDAESGKVIWQQSYPCPTDPHFYEGGPSATPTVDGGRVYTLSKTAALYCFAAADGKILWSENVAQMVGAKAPTWGFAGSPVVEGKLVLLNVGAAGTAVDKTSGKVVWKSGPDVSGYSTPVPATFDGHAAIVMMLKDAAAGLDMETGQELWREPWKVNYDLNCPDAIVRGAKVFVTSLNKPGSALLEIHHGTAAVLWQTKDFANQLNSSVLVDGFLYGVDGIAGPTPSATLKCVDFQTGAVKWNYKGLGGGSLMVAGEKFIALSDSGELVTAPVSPEGFHPLSSAQVLGGKCWTVPVLANGRIYCRNARGDLACLDVRGN